MRWHLQAAAPTDCSDNVPSVTVVISMCPKISPILSKVKQNDYQKLVVKIHILTERELEDLGQTKVLVSCRFSRWKFSRQLIPVGCMFSGMKRGKLYFLTRTQFISKTIEERFSMPSFAKNVNTGNKALKLLF